MSDQNHSILTTDHQLRLKRVRTVFSRLADQWVLAYNDRLHPDIIRFLLHGAKPELRGLFLNLKSGKGIYAFLDMEKSSPPFSAEEFDAILWHLEVYAAFLPKAKGRTARTRIARNKRYVAELPERVALFRAMLAEEERNIANAPYDVRMLERLETISRAIRYDETDSLHKELELENDPYLRWTVESALGQASCDQPPMEPPLPQPDCSGTPLELLAERCQAEHQVNRREFRTWACRAAINKLNDHFIREFAMLLIGVRKYQWDFREEPDAEESLPLTAWRERAEVILSRSGTLERHERWVLAAKIAAFTSVAETVPFITARLLALREPESVIRDCLLTALAARNGSIGRDEAVQRVDALISDAHHAAEEELRQGITLYSMPQSRAGRSHCQGHVRMLCKIYQK